MIPAHRLEEWLRGLSPGQAEQSTLLAGLLHATAAGLLPPAGAHGRIVPWRLTDEDFARIEALDLEQLAWLVGPAHDLRLAIDPAAHAAGLLPRLLAPVAVDSAFFTVDRPAGALSPRPWRWPLRVGLLGFSREDGTAVIEALGSPLLDIHRVDDEPGAVDVAVVARPLTDAVAAVLSRRPRANAILVLDAPDERPVLIDAHLATLRAATGAAASALVSPKSLPALLGELVEELARSSPFDVALTHAADRELELWAEPAAMETATVSRIAERHARFAARVPALTAPEPHAALEVARFSAALEPALDALEQERWCQVRQRERLVDFFIGPAEEGALRPEEPLDETQLPSDERDSFLLTVVFIPIVADVVPQQAELELPRFGRTRDVTFELPAGASAARILVLYRNRVLQATLLDDGALRQTVAVVPSLAGLDDRRPFDAAVFANHASGQPLLARVANGQTRVSNGAALIPKTKVIADLLSVSELTAPSVKRGAASPAARKLLISLAVEGRDLHELLEDQIGGLAAAERIQIVSASSTWFLPLELAYDRFAPDDDATICANYLADPETCTGRCTPVEDRTSLCPNAFWGLSKTIERHRFDADVDPDPVDGHILLAPTQPRRGRRELAVERALFGASDRVKDPGRANTLAALGAQAAAATGWETWLQALAGQDTQLLVLLPHTDYSALTLEIASDALRRGRIERDYVTGNRGVEPIVILFGCRTSGTAGDPVGFAARFMQKGASAVFHSAADLHVKHAADLAQRLTARLTRNGRSRELLSDALTAFRREAVRDGLVIALGIAAFGDADWSV